jgi:hypothetical protein
MKKCICKKCEDCRLFRSWIMTNDKGEQKVLTRCDIQVIAEELPKLRGSVDGCQVAANETKNRVLEFGGAATRVIASLPNIFKRRQIENDNRDPNT